MKPRIAITMGDPAGIGPEIIVGAWNETVVHDWCRPLVVGNPKILRRAVSLWQMNLEVIEIDDPKQAKPRPDVIPCIPCGSDNVLDVKPGTIDARTGLAAYQYAARAIELAIDGSVDAITTAPISKKAWALADIDLPGHTELLARMCDVDDFAMMLYLGPDDGMCGEAGLAVVHVTLHTALRNVFDMLTQEAILAKIRSADHFMRRLKGDRPRIGICSLNPHRGESGMFGTEEQMIIEPAVKQAIAEGLDVTGPMPTDTLMVHARDGEFDAVVAMFHDQGHIALKLLGMHRAVNITLGLPIVRTSVAHGTAFDIAWKRQAETGSLLEAIRVAAQLASA